MDTGHTVTTQIDEMAVKIGTWPDEPLRVLGDHVDAMLQWCALRGASDITIQTDRPVFIEVHGVLYPVTRRALRFRPTWSIS